MTKTMHKGFRYYLFTALNMYMIPIPARFFTAKRSDRNWGHGVSWNSDCLRWKEFSLTRWAFASMLRGFIHRSSR